MAHRLALFLAAGASVTAHAQDASTCGARDGICAGVAPMLLQTHRAMDKVTEANADAHVPPLPPAFVAPDGAETYAKAERATASALAVPPGAEDLSLLADYPSTYSSNDWNVYLQTKALRQQGFTCPGGQSFAPNSGEFLFDCRLWRAAVLHSQDMGRRNYFDHVDPDGKDPFDRSKAQGFGTFNENIAAGVSDATGTMAQWKKSDGHCTNMMKASHTRMGAGYASVSGSTYTHYWTQLFGSGNGAADTSCYGSGGGGYTPSPSPGPSPSPSGGGSSGCSDASANCASWQSAGYCSSSSQYYGYMQGNCKAACGFCGGGGGYTPSPSPSPGGGGNSGCSDANTNCASWKSTGYCSSSSQYYGYMQSNCKASCGVCGGASTGGGGSSTCSDSSSSCGSWVSAGYCSSSSQYYGYMRQNCPRSCSMCR